MAVTRSFRIYYDDLEPYSGPVFEAPGLGVLCIVELDRDHGRRLVTQGDYYVWRDGRWYGVDYPGLVDYLLQAGPRKVLLGRLVERERFYRAVRQAEEDPDFPVRTAWAAGEERLDRV